MSWKYQVFKKSYETNDKISKSSHQTCFVNKVFLEISQNSQENTCARDSFLIKLQAAPATLLKKSLWHRCFRVNFAKFLRTPFLQNTSGRLLLKQTHLLKVFLFSFNQVKMFIKVKVFIEERVKVNIISNIISVMLAH